MKLDDAVFDSKAWTLGLGSALGMVRRYYGELLVTGDLTPRWKCWFMSMVFFAYVVSSSWVVLQLPQTPMLTQ